MWLSGTCFYQEMTNTFITSNISNNVTHQGYKPTLTLWCDLMNFNLKKTNAFPTIVLYILTSFWAYTYRFRLWMEVFRKLLLITSKKLLLKQDELPPFVSDFGLHVCTCFFWLWFITSFLLKVDIRFRRFDSNMN